MRFADGRLCAHEVIIPKGERLNPMTAEEVKEKFLPLAIPVIREAKARTVIDEVRSLRERESLEALLSALRDSS